MKNYDLTEDECLDIIFKQWFREYSAKNELRKNSKNLLAQIREYTERFDGALSYERPITGESQVLNRGQLIPGDFYAKMARNSRGQGFVPEFGFQFIRFTKRNGEVEIKRRNQNNTRHYLSDLGVEPYSTGIWSQNSCVLKQQEKQ